MSRAAPAIDARGAAAAEEPVRTLQAALALALGGLPVFPCHPDTKAPLCRNGFYAASRTAADIRALWRGARWSGVEPAIGVPMGPASGAFVLDFDPEAGQDPIAMVHALERTLRAPIPSTWSVATPRGGIHLYFRFDPAQPVTNRRNMLPGVDVRGAGGYVIVPPSETSDGRRWQWLEGPLAVSLGDAPKALLELARGL